MWKGRRKTIKGKIRGSIFVVLLIFMIIFFCFCIKKISDAVQFEPVTTSAESSGDEEPTKTEKSTIETRLSDDQRSTLWPMFVSVVIAVLGCLITTYIFLKGALDETVKDKPYYRRIVNSYREKTITFLWVYACTVLLFVMVAFGMYYSFYFWGRRTWQPFRSVLFLLYLVEIAGAVYILHRCIYVDEGLCSAAEKQLKKDLDKLKHAESQVGNIFEFLSVLNLTKEELVSWLQIEQEKDGRTIDRKKFISRFSDWESLLMTLVQQDDKQLDFQLLEEQLEFTIYKGVISYYPNRNIRREPSASIEWSDADQNNWKSTPVRKIFRCMEGICRATDGEEDIRTVQGLVKEYRFLAQCRNMLKILKDSEQRDEDNVWDEEDERRLACVFFRFLVEVSTLVLRLSPRIEVFFPSGRFTVADFYSVRFENSSFRASLFTDSVFARTKIKGTNFSVCKFEQCEFFNADCRDCSFSNTYLSGCSFQGAIFDDIDFTGAAITGCNFSGATFQKVVFLNMRLAEMVLHGNNFIDCKLDNIDISLCYDRTKRISMRGCRFSECVLTNICPHLPTVSPARSIGSTVPVVTAFQAVVGSKTVLNCLFPPKEAGDVAFLEEVNRFKLESSVFSGRPSASGTKNTIPIHPLWKAIQGWTFVSMEESIFENTVMPAFRFYRVNLEQSVFRAAQIDGARLFCVYMPGCILPHANLREAALWGVVLQSAVLNEAILFRAVCKLVNFEDAALCGLHASESSFHGCSFSRSDCRGVDLTRAKLFDCLFWDSILSNAELTGAEFHAVQFDNSVADRMLASYTEFQQCSLSNAYLSGSNFNYTIFEDCDFRLADFSESTVTSAVFRRCNFAGSNFKGACFISTRFEDCFYLGSGLFDGARFIAASFRGIDPEFLNMLEEQGAVQELEGIV